jgi:DNA-binding transcriptional LysR family regulator
VNNFLKSEVFIISLLRMKILVLMDKYKQVTAVANALHMKQPTISFHMKKMEAEWGVTLFEAKAGRILLSNAGKIFLPYAMQINALYSEAEVKIAEYRDNEKTLLQIGCTDCALSTMARSSWLTNLDQLAGIQVSLQSSDEETLYSQLQANLLDLVICGTPPRDSFPFEADQIVTSSLKLIVPAGHPLIQATQLAPHNLYKYKFIDHTEDSVHRIVASWRAQLHWKLEISAKFNSAEMIISAVHAGLGLSILPNCLLPDPANRVVALDLPGNESAWNLYASWRPNYWNPSLLRQVLSSESL